MVCATPGSLTNLSIPFSFSRDTDRRWSWCNLNIKLDFENNWCCSLNESDFHYLEISSNYLDGILAEELLLYSTNAHWSAHCCATSAKDESHSKIGGHDVTALSETRF